MNLKDNTKFELTLESESLIHIRKIPSKLEPVFPKIEVPQVSSKDMKEFMDGLMNIEPSELEKDERLTYILVR